MLMNRVVLELGIYTSHIVWRIRYRKVIREAKVTGKTVDEILEPEGNVDVEKGEAQGEAPGGREEEREGEGEEKRQNEETKA